MSPEIKNSALKTAWISILVTIILIAAKLTGGLLSGSLALISLATESALDLLSVIITLLAVRITAKPADTDHPYGHGKFDSISALFQSFLLLGISIWIFYEATIRLLHPSAANLTIDYVTFAILIGAFILDFWRSRRLNAVGKEERSQSLQSNAIHFLGDSLSVVVVFIGLLFSKYLKLDGADSYAAMLVSGFVAMLSIRQGKQALDELTDRFAHTEDYDKVFAVIKETRGIHELEKLRMRHSGPNLFIDASVAINRVLPFASVEHILSEVKERIDKIFPTAEVNIRTHAVKLENESTFETIKLVTSEEGLLPHNIELSKDINGGVILDLHLEFPTASNFYEAHKKSEVIEEHIKKNIPSISKIILHLEEERPDYDIPVVKNITATKTILAEEMSRLARTADPAIIAIQDLTLLESQPYKELKLALTIILDKKLSLTQAHDIVTNVEQVLRNRFSELSRIVIHSEPDE